MFVCLPPLHLTPAAGLLRHLAEAGPPSGLFPGPGLSRGSSNKQNQRAKTLHSFSTPGQRWVATGQVPLQAGRGPGVRGPGCLGVSGAQRSGVFGGPGFWGLWGVLGSGVQGAFPGRSALWSTPGAPLSQSPDAAWRETSEMGLSFPSRPKAVPLTWPWRRSPDQSLRGWTFPLCFQPDPLRPTVIYLVGAGPEFHPDFLPPNPLQK